MKTKKKPEVIMLEYLLERAQITVKYKYGRCIAGDNLTASQAQQVLDYNCAEGKGSLQHQQAMAGRTHRKIQDNERSRKRNVRDL